MEPLELVLTQNSYTKIMASFKSSIFGILMFVLIIIAAAAAAADNYTSSEQHLKVNFEVNLDVRRLSPAGYRAFQANLREKLAARDIGPEGNKVAVLPPDNGAAPQWFNVRLTGAGGKTTTLRFRVGNLYFVGYQMGATWYEFGRSGDMQWIPNSQFLGFEEGYAALATAADKRVTEINLNGYSFDKAVKTLATSTIRQERARALIVVSLMVPEACRFVVLSNGLSTKLPSNEPVYLKDWMMADIVREWGAYSKMLLCYNQFPTTYNFPRPTINQTVIATADDLRKRLGILLNVQVDRRVCQINANDVELPGVIAFQAQVRNPVELAGVEA